MSNKFLDSVLKKLMIKHLFYTTSRLRSRTILNMKKSEERNIQCRYIFETTIQPNFGTETQKTYKFVTVRDADRSIIVAVRKAIAEPKFGSFLGGIRTN